MTQQMVSAAICLVFATVMIWPLLKTLIRLVRTSAMPNVSASKRKFAIGYFSLGLICLLFMFGLSLYAIVSRWLAG